MRTDVEQWTAFVARLGGLGLDFEILLLGWEDSVGRADVPPNVVITQLPYSASERSVIDGLVDAGSEAAYLGLWRNPERSLFVSTSLSSKLATYAAAGLPVLYDGPESTPAWRLIDRYRAGVACSTTEDTVALRAVFEDENAHAELSAGAIRLCRTEFDLDRSVERLRERFVAASKEHTKRPGRKDSA
jgi:hypothetical protein